MSITVTLQHTTNPHCPCPAAWLQQGRAGPTLALLVSCPTQALGSLPPHLPVLQPPAWAAGSRQLQNKALYGDVVSQDTHVYVPAALCPVKAPCQSAGTGGHTSAGAGQRRHCTCFDPQLYAHSALFLLDSHLRVQLQWRSIRLSTLCSWYLVSWGAIRCSHLPRCLLHLHPLPGPEECGEVSSTPSTTPPARGLRPPQLQCAHAAHSTSSPGCLRPFTAGMGVAPYCAGAGLDPMLPYQEYAEVPSPCSAPTTSCPDTVNAVAGPGSSPHCTARCLVVTSALSLADTGVPGPCGCWAVLGLRPWVRLSFALSSCRSCLCAVLDKVLPLPGGSSAGRLGW